MAKQTKTKRKLAHPMLPMQRQLNLQHEGTHFDLRPIFDRLNERYFRGRLRGYKVMWGRRRRHRYPDQSITGSTLRPALVSTVRALPRNAAFSGTGGKR